MAVMMKLGWVFGAPAVAVLVAYYISEEQAGTIAIGETVDDYPRRTVSDE